MARTKAPSKRQRDAASSDNSNDDDDDDVEMISRPAKRVNKAKAAPAPVDEADVAPAAPLTKAAKGKGRANIDADADEQQQQDADDPVMDRLAVAQLRAENAKLKADMKARDAAYRKVQARFEELRNLRSTEGETREAELVDASDQRAQAYRKQIATYADEAEQLRAQVEDLKQEVLQLRLHSGDGDATTFIGETQATGSGARMSGQLEAERQAHAEALERLEAEQASLHARLREAEKLRRAQLAEAEEGRRRAVAEAEARAAQAERELAFEVEQSKKHLLDRGKPLPSAPAVGSQAASGEEAVQAQLRERLRKLQEDLTGLTCLSSKQDDPPSTKSFSFLLSDFKRKKSLYFRLMISGDDSDGGNPKYDFVPIFEPGRDDEIKACLDKTLQAHIQFNAPQLHHFFRRLYKSMNNLQIKGENKGE